jgi:hypothetical protein
LLSFFIRLFTFPLLSLAAWLVGSCTLLSRFRVRAAVDGGAAAVKSMPPAFLVGARVEAQYGKKDTWYLGHVQVGADFRAPIQSYSFVVSRNPAFARRRALAMMCAC